MHLITDLVLCVNDRLLSSFSYLRHFFKRLWIHLYNLFLALSYLKMDNRICRILTILCAVSCATCCIRKPPGYLHHQQRLSGDNGYSITIQKTKSYLETDKYVPGTAYTRKYYLLRLLWILINVLCFLCL